MIIFIILLFIVLILGPNWWVKRTINKHQIDLDYIPGTGAELAEHLLNKLQIENITVELTEAGDHYDPVNRKIGLTEQIYSGRSLAAVAIAAHEVGHAIQHRQQMPLFNWRGRLVTLAVVSEKLGVMALMAAPIIGGLVRIPHPVVALTAIGVGSLLVGVIVHLITLPVEWDASFNKALPILTKGEYVNSSDEKVIRQILTAAAMTYVAATLASILNIWRWLAVLRH
jgi:Zn-dependent membrane protease YugP